MLRIAAFIVTVVACVRGLSENGVCPNSDAACTQDARFEDDNTYKFNVRTLSGAHPAVKPLEEQYKATTSMNAKIRLSRCWSSVNHSPNLFRVRYVRSLVPGRVDIWYDDGEGGTEQGHLSMGQVRSTIALANVCLVTVRACTGNHHQLVRGAHIFLHYSGQQEQRGRQSHDGQGPGTYGWHHLLRVVSHILLFVFQVLYLVEDPKRPAPAKLRDASYREFDFMADYQNRTGIQWRHYYGPNGPRPPPGQFMWPASHVGQVHSVTSQEGYW
jgi:hypothetical protein